MDYYCYLGETVKSIKKKKEESKSDKIFIKKREGNQNLKANLNRVSFTLYSHKLMTCAIFWDFQGHYGNNG